MKLITIFLLVSFGFNSPPLSHQTQSPNENLFKPSQSTSFSKSKRILKEIYIKSGHNKTLYCGCHFSEDKKIDFQFCGYAPRKSTNPRSSKLEWEHIVPASFLGKNLKCWKEKICLKGNDEKYKGRRCCRKQSKKFKKMESDMHNLVPSVGEINGDRSNLPYGIIDGEERKYGKCDFEKDNGRVEPKESIRGDIARSYFYMSIQYQIKLPDSLEDMLRKWHFSDPPDEWERDRNTFIEEKQGNRNPFIDFPETLIREVNDF